MRRVLALERLGGVDGLLGLPTLVIQVDQVELRLPGLGRERVTGLERLEGLDRGRVVGRVHLLLALVVKLGRAAVAHEVVAAAATGQGRDREQRENEQLERTESAHLLTAWWAIMPAT